MTTVNIFRRIRTPDKNLDKVQDGVAAFAQQVATKFKELGAATVTSMLRFNLPEPLVASTVAADVSGKSFLFVDTSNATLQVYNLSGGVNGQVVFIIKLSGSNSMTLNHASTLQGGEPMYLSAGAAIVVGSGDYGGIGLVHRNGGWYHFTDYT